MPRPTLPPGLTTGPFTMREARAAGVPLGLLRGPQVRRMHTGVYAAAALPLDHRLRVAAALKALPADALPTGATTLRLLGVEVGPTEPLRFLTAHRHQRRVPGVTASRVRVIPTADRRVHGILVGPKDQVAEHAFLGAATDLHLLGLVTAGDWLVRLAECTPESLTTYCGGARGAEGVLARRAADLVRARVDSPRETRLRLCLVLAGLPEPECNPIVGDAEPIGRGDLLYRRYRVVGEYEGDHHRVDRGQWNTDIARAEAYADQDWRLLRVTAQQMRRPRTVVGRFLRALRAGGYEGPDPEFGPEWRSIFG